MRLNAHMQLTFKETKLMTGASIHIEGARERRKDWANMNRSSEKVSQKACNDTIISPVAFQRDDR